MIFDKVFLYIFVKTARQKWRFCLLHTGLQGLSLTSHKSKSTNCIRLKFRTQFFWMIWDRITHIQYQLQDPRNKLGTGFQLKFKNIFLRFKSKYLYCSSQNKTIKKKNISKTAKFYVVEAYKTMQFDWMTQWNFRFSSLSFPKEKKIR